MTHPQTITRSRLLSGTTWIALAEALMLPTGFLTVVILTRWIGSEGYGLFALAATLVTWIEWGINSIFSRTTIKFVGEAADWRSVATTVLRVQLGVSLLAAFILALLAPTIASLLHEPVLTYLLWLFALEIPLFNLVQGHQNILTGMGDFGARAMVSAVRWTTRLLFIAFLVGVGLSVPGAILGSVASMLFSLGVCRFYIRPSLWQSSNFSAQQLAGYAAPLFLSALAIRVYERLDLVALKALGRTTEEVGIYAVAQNLALLGQVLSPALASVILASLSQLLSQAKIPQLKALSRSTMRTVLLHLPFVGLVWGSASDIVIALFGTPFAPAAPLFAVLMFAAIASVMIAVTSAILIASEKPYWTLVMAAPMPIGAMVGYWTLIPRLGSIGASITTLLVASIGAVAGIIAVYIRWRVLPPGMTLVRSCLVCGLVAVAASLWHTPGFWLLPKLLGLTLTILLMLWLLGEFTSADKALVRSLLLDKFKRQ